MTRDIDDPDDIDDMIIVIVDDGIYWQWPTMMTWRWWWRWCWHYCWLPVRFPFHSPTIPPPLIYAVRWLRWFDPHLRYPDVVRDDILHGTFAMRLRFRYRSHSVVRFGWNFWLMNSYDYRLLLLLLCYGCYPFPLFIAVILLIGVRWFRWLGHFPVGPYGDYLRWFVTVTLLTILHFNVGGRFTLGLIYTPHYIWHSFLPVTWLFGDWPIHSTHCACCTTRCVTYRYLLLLIRWPHRPPTVIQLHLLLQTVDVDLLRVPHYRYLHSTCCWPLILVIVPVYRYLIVTEFLRLLVLLTVWLLTVIVVHLIVTLPLLRSRFTTLFVVIVTYVVGDPTCSQWWPTLTLHSIHLTTTLSPTSTPDPTFWWCWLPIYSRWFVVGDFDCWPPRCCSGPIYSVPDIRCYVGGIGVVCWHSFLDSPLVVVTYLVHSGVLRLHTAVHTPRSHSELVRTPHAFGSWTTPHLRLILFLPPRFTLPFRLLHSHYTDTAAAFPHTTPACLPPLPTYSHTLVPHTGDPTQILRFLPRLCRYTPLVVLLDGPHHARYRSPHTTTYSPYHGDSRSPVTLIAGDLIPFPEGTFVTYIPIPVMTPLLTIVHRYSRTWYTPIPYTIYWRIVDILTNWRYGTLPVVDDSLQWIWCYYDCSRWLIHCWNLLLFMTLIPCWWLLIVIYPTDSPRCWRPVIWRYSCCWWSVLTDWHTLFVVIPELRYWHCCCWWRCCYSYAVIVGDLTDCYNPELLLRCCIRCYIRCWKICYSDPTVLLLMIVWRWRPICSWRYSYDFPSTCDPIWLMFHLYCDLAFPSPTTFIRWPPRYFPWRWFWNAERIYSSDMTLSLYHIPIANLLPRWRYVGCWIVVDWGGPIGGTLQCDLILCPLCWWRRYRLPLHLLLVPDRRCSLRCRDSTVIDGEAGIYCCCYSVVL